MLLTSLLDHLDAMREVLRQRPMGLFIDVDGTLVDIAQTPLVVEVSPAVRHNLERIGERALVSVLTGREVDEARGIVGSDELLYVGSHGTQWWQHGRGWVASEAEPYTSYIQELTTQAMRVFGSKDGYIVQDKGLSASIHYRQTSDPDAARAAVFRFLAESSDAQRLSIFEGKMVAEVRPPINLNKGTALRSIALSNSLRGAVVIGDDTADVDMFRAVADLRRAAGLIGLSVAVLGPEAPAELIDAADYTLSGPLEVHRFLDWMAKAFN